MKILFLRVSSLVLCLPPAIPAFAQAAPAEVAQSRQLTAEEWREDLRFMIDEMKRRHPNLYHSVSRERFDAAVADLNARIPSLRRNEIIVGMMRIAASVGDGHTRIEPRKDPAFAFPSLPLKLYLFDDGLFVRAARPDHQDLVGAEIVGIGGVPVAEAIRRAAEISARDNEIGPRLFVPLFLNMPDVLHALKLSASSDHAMLTLRRHGRTWTAKVAAGDIEPLWPPDTDVSLITPEGWVDARTSPERPLWLQAPLDYHRLIDLPARRALYTQLNMVAEIKGQSLAQFGRRIREQAEAANPRALIIDLRLNHGGNHDLRHKYVSELVKAEDEDTRLFVLTRRGTYSASEAILVDLARLTDAIFIGEPASSKPNSFGDAYRTPLPNSGISVRTSIQWNQLAGQSDDPWTWVEVATPYKLADYSAGKDPALEAALNYRDRPTLADRLLLTKGAAAVKEAAEAYRSDPINRYADVELDMLRGALRLQGAKRAEDSLLVAQLAAGWYPRSTDAQLVLGQIADQAGQKAIAVAAVRRALQLDPNSRSGRSLLQRLTQPSEGS